MPSSKKDWISTDKIDGKCCIKHIYDIDDLDDYKDSSVNAFYVTEEVPDNQIPNVSHPAALDRAGEFRCSKETQAEESTARIKKDEFLRHGETLKALELFSGIGGLSTGIHMSGAVETKWAIEAVPAVARIFKLNHPDTTVYNEDVNDCLARAIKQEAGLPDRDKKDITGKPVHAMPWPGR